MIIKTTKDEYVVTLQPGDELEGSTIKGVFEAGYLLENGKFIREEEV